MERLNEILGRTPQRPQPRSAQQPPSDHAQEDQARGTRSQNGRQPHDEPITRPIHRTPSFMQNAQPRHSAMPKPEPVESSNASYIDYQGTSKETHQIDHSIGKDYRRNERFSPGQSANYRSQNQAQRDFRRQEYRKQHPAQAQQYSHMDSGTDYQLHSRPQYEEPRIEPLQPPQAVDFPARNVPKNYLSQYSQGTPSTHPRRAADDYIPSLHADAVDEWEVGGMGYGDWESEDPSIYREDNIQIIEDNADSPAIYQVYPQRNINAEMPTTYNTIDVPRSNQQHNYQEYEDHDQYPSLPRASQPTTQSSDYRRSYETPEYQQRITQPLDPQMIVDISRESKQESTDKRILRALRGPSTEAKIEPIKLPEPVEMVSKPKVPCPRCHGAGYLRSNVPFGHPNFGKPVPCKCKEAEQKDKRRQQLREMSNMDSFLDHTFKTFKSHIIGVKEAYQVAIEFANEPDGWLLLVGPNGCGKTHLAAAIANQQLLRGGVVLFEAVPDLLDHLRAAFAPSATEVYDQLFSKMREAELLILDDLGAQQSSPWANEKLFQLLNYRYNIGMPTVITANTKGMMAVDEHVRSRLDDHSLVRRVNMDHVRDYRPNNTRKR